MSALLSRRDYDLEVREFASSPSSASLAIAVERPRWWQAKRPPDNPEACFIVLEIAVAHDVEGNQTSLDVEPVHAIGGGLLAALAAIGTVLIERGRGK
jgi:hypothetical protein